MLSGVYKSLYDQLIKVIDPKRLYHDPLHTLAFGTDASFYRLIPQLVIKAKDEDEVILILKACTKLAIPVTFRAAGTSLSGQAISDSVLVIAGNSWKKYTILEDGLKIKVQPGLTGGRVNTLLAPYGRKIGPDPASVNSAMIGGIAANNASGMCCGTAENSYNTVDGMRIIFTDGTLLDTSDAESKKQFRITHNHLIDKISAMAEAVKNNLPLADKISRKYKMKNTTGYSLNALVDFSDPFEILEHLMIGSEGTLGFIAEITYKTVVEHPFKASSLMIFPDITKGCQAVLLLKDTPVAAVELIDRAGLRAVEDQHGMPGFLKTINPHGCAILVETRASNSTDMENQLTVICNAVSSIQPEFPIAFTSDPAQYEVFWKIRKGLFPSVGAMRKAGTTVIIEDVTFPVPRLAEATLDLQTLFQNWGYNEAVIFGHALEGNLHFVFNQDFGSQDEIERYSKFMAQVVTLVIDKYDGSLKAEHGTGRNMAPFVEKEWGEEAYELMKQLKNLLDPGNLLNPGVILSNDPEIHLKNLKPIPAASELIDKCIECGFCEPSCVSSELTLTPRQRIVVYREIKNLTRNNMQPHILAALTHGFKYAGNETCATDGLCATSCPVNIDTGKLIKQLREEELGTSQKGAQWIAKRMGLVIFLGRKGLSLVGFFHSLLGTSLMQRISNGITTISGKRVPRWNPFLPRGAKPIKAMKNHIYRSERKVVYFPSCINRTMGLSSDQRGEKQLSETMVHLLQKGGFEVIYPKNLTQQCCGMAFSSKGYAGIGKEKSDELEDVLTEASENGKYPILCDMSPCLYSMRENMAPTLKLYEPAEFILDHLIAHLEITPVDETITVFPVCSMKKMGLEGKLLELAKRCATVVVVPQTNCCGFAGDRGFTVPELNSHGLQELKSQIPTSCKHGYSTSRTCEIGLSLHSGISYQSVVYLVDRVSQPLRKKPS